MNGVDAGLTDLLRRLAPQVLGALVRHGGTFDAAEDAVQEALIAAAERWPVDGQPQNPRGWLIRVAARRLADQRRSDVARTRREMVAAQLVPADDHVAPPADEMPPAAEDDTLDLLFLCCHPALSRSSQVALTLRAVGGLTTAEIGRAFLVPEPTMSRRIGRAKQRIREAGATFGAVTGIPRERLDGVLRVLYLIFNEGYSASAGPHLHRPELTTEAIRLTRQVRGRLPRDGEVAGLLALMLLTEARRPARADADGNLIPLADQDRRLWRADLIVEGVELITETLPRSLIGPYQIQAAVAAVHAEARSAGETDWAQIEALYQLLECLEPNPMTTLNRAVASAMIHGPQAGLDVITHLAGDDRLAGHHRLYAVRAHLLELAGDVPAARTDYLTAARFTTSLPERRYLEARAARLD
ncbi:RNA polymerase sigma factor [Micromonospora sp. URMC 103]|uniref:RNA polymerase sigma factor n=1 Tax=Micromonospora sp. URMC 103 TaxID=3423406 RepID=UPI003F199FF0